MIKYLRRRKGLTQRQLGEEVGLTYQSVQKWENGTGKPTTTQLSAVCRVLGISVEQMLAGALPDSDDSMEQPQHIAVPIEKDSTEGGLGALERLQYELRIKELELEKEQMANQFRSEIIQLKDQEIERQRKEIERQRSTAS